MSSNNLTVGSVAVIPPLGFLFDFVDWADLESGDSTLFETEKLRTELLTSSHTRTGNCHRSNIYLFF
jgi:hypothetical protein